MDNVERHVDIDAPPERVWELLTRPGWFVNDGEIVAHEVEDLGEGAYLVTDPVHGSFRIEEVRLEPHTRAVFRWHRGTGPDDPATQVEFRLAERPGGVRLTVVESGLEALGVDRRLRQGQEQGWTEELEVARAHTDPARVRRAVHVPAGPDRAWDVVADLASWYAFGGAAYTLIEDAPMRLEWAEHGIFLGRVERVAAPSELAFRLAQEPDTEPGADAPLVRVTVRASGTGSLVTVEHTGLASEDEAAMERLGWEGGLTTLAERLRGQ
ncbi:SRPBCC domain-containing protein [Nocardiopsis sp. HNM0947]|uniref:SRPBCC domain-containing protein n=1 Tax=Nocardiopsis coralli TaxID=2772213 RepID=A0ABR9P3W5_9ACTN|nr:SRPBCC domain-containing protein [Nocardiopsis coralli]MBE2998533.1 SRPBCC domain-containing protein [Nocardiopsis coralli]